MGNCLESSVTLILVFLSPDTSQTGSQLSLPVKPTEHVDNEVSAAAKTVADSLGAGQCMQAKAEGCVQSTPEDQAQFLPGQIQWSCFGRQSNK